MLLSKLICILGNLISMTDAEQVHEVRRFDNFRDIKEIMQRNIQEVLDNGEILVRFSCCVLKKESWDFDHDAKGDYIPVCKRIRDVESVLCKYSLKDTDNRCFCPGCIRALLASRDKLRATQCKCKECSPVVCACSCM